MNGVELPDLTADAETAKQHLAEFGCARLTGALDPAQLARLRERIVGIAAEEVRDDRDYVYSGGSNQRIWLLVNRGREFLELAEHPVGLDVLASLLGRELVVSNLSANITGPGGSPMKPHWDQDWAERPWPHALAAHIIWMIDDFTVANGATLIAPGSHLVDTIPPDEDMRPATGPAGTALLLDARTWHGTGANVSTGERRIGVLAYYSRPYIRLQENFALSMDGRVRESLTPEQRRLYGFESYEYLNMVGGPPRDEPRY